MSKSVNGKFQSLDQARNTWDDLIGSDIPQDLIYIDEDAGVIRVMMPPEEAREVHEIFDRHGIEHE